MGQMSKKDDGVRLVHASLMRMGTMSMSEAYKILGFNPHHALTMDSKKAGHIWKGFDRAVNGTWPEVNNTNHQKRLTREDWEAIRGDWDIFTDLFSHFSPDIIKAYPEAKVVIVQREFDPWWRSYKARCVDALKPWYVPLITLPAIIFWGVSPTTSCEKQYKGFFKVKSIDDIDKATARKAYDSFFSAVRSLVPPERRLEFNVSDGWEPLCAFLDKPVPDVPFPRTNSYAEHESSQNALIWRLIVGCITVILLLVGAMIYGIGWAWKKI